MFGFLKKKNKLKELEDRVIAIEKKFTISKVQEEIKKSLKKDYNQSTNYEKDILNLENAEFISKMSNELAKAIKENNKIKSNESTVELVLEIDKTEIGKFVIDSINKVQRQGGTKLLRI